MHYSYRTLPTQPTNHMVLIWCIARADEGAEGNEIAPVVGGPAADVTFSACVQRTLRPPECVPPIHDMAENTDHGTCMLCFQPDFQPGPDFSGRTMIVCDSCEREFHVGCLRECGLGTLHELPVGEWFCSQTCFAIHKEVNGALPASSSFRLSIYPSEYLFF
jgi:hypothetical protein